jgi:hypothetical protein
MPGSSWAGRLDVKAVADQGTFGLFWRATESCLVFFCPSPVEKCNDAVKSEQEWKGHELTVRYTMGHEAGKKRARKSIDCTVDNERQSINRCFCHIPLTKVQSREDNGRDDDRQDFYQIRSMKSPKVLGQ